MPDYFYYDDGSGYPYDEFEYDEDYYDEDYYDEGFTCLEDDCNLPTNAECQCCGGPLCHMHNELGCGFCTDCPTQEWINEQHNGT
jgi:hypothetical protein